MLQEAQSESVRTSDILTLGDIYCRAELREMFDISDATINTGVFRPKGHDSVWLPCSISAGSPFKRTITPLPCIKAFGTRNTVNGMASC